MAEIHYLTAGKQPDRERLVVDRIEDIARIAEQAATSTLQLQREARDLNPSVSQAAAAAITSLLECAALSREALETPRRPKSWLWGAHLEIRVLKLRSRIGIGRGLPPAVHRNWPGIGLAVTLMSCWAIFNSLYFLAMGLILGRVVISTLLGYESTLPFESATPSGLAKKSKPTDMWASSSGARLVSRCLIGHLCDTLPLLAFGHMLGTQGRSMWASVVLGSVCVMLFATLFRVSALQVGVPLNRLMLERLLRVSTLLLALVAAGVLQPAVPLAGVPLLAIAAVGPACYAAIEIIRTTYYLCSDRICTGEGGWTVLLSRSNSQHAESYLKEVQQLAS